MKKKAVVLFILVLAAILASAFLIKGGKVFLAREMKLRSSPVAQSIESQILNFPSRKNVIVYGDSRVSYWKLLPENVGAIGHPGASAVELNTSHIEKVNGEKIERVYIQCGVNDLKVIGYADQEGRS